MHIYCGYKAASKGSNGTFEKHGRIFVQPLKKQFNRFQLNCYKACTYRMIFESLLKKLKVKKMNKDRKGDNWQSSDGDI